MKHLRNLKFTIPCVALIMTLSGCGKVTQTSGKPQEATTFDLKYSVSTVSTADATYKAAPANYFTPSDTTVYSVVIGLEKAGKTQELSWGKAILSIKSAGTASGNTLNAKVTALRKGDIEIDSADYSWSKLNYDPIQQSWSADVKKLKIPYRMYLVAFYTPKGKSYLTILDSSRVSANSTLLIPPITLYDTFIASLLMHDLQAQKGEIDATQTPGKLKVFFTEDFFELLNYKIPVTTATQFNPDNPNFIFSSDLEKRLLTLYEFWNEGEYSEGLSMLTKYKKASPEWIPSKAEAWWIAKFKETQKEKKADNILAN